LDEAASAGILEFYAQLVGFFAGERTDLRRIEHPALAPPYHLQRPVTRGKAGPLSISDDLRFELPSLRMAKSWQKSL